MNASTPDDQALNPIEPPALPPKSAYVRVEIARAHAKLDAIEREVEKWLGGRSAAIKKLVRELREIL